MKRSERRREPRLQVMLDAIVHPERGRTWPCTIHDVCSGGMLLKSEEGARRSLRASGLDPEVGDVLHVHFSVPDLQGTRNFRVTAKVARILSNGLGVYFPDDRALLAFRALQGYADTRDFARKKREGAEAEGTAAKSRLSEKDAAVVRSLIHDLSQRALGQCLSATFDRVNEDLSLQARNAGSDAGYNLMLGGMNRLRRAQQIVTEQVIASVLDQIDTPEDLAQASQRQHTLSRQGESRLSLVDTEQFEDWLLVADVISRAETRYAEDLVALSLRLALVAPAWSRKDALPVGPTVLSVAFDDAVKPLELEREIRQILFGCFCDVLIAFLRRFYPALRKTLDDSGLFPSAEQLIRAASRSAEAAKDKVPTAEGVATDPAAPRRRRQGGSGPAHGGQTGGHPEEPALLDVSEAVAESAQEDPPRGGQRAGRHGVPGRSGGRAHVRVGNVYGAARELMHLQRALPGPDGLPSEAPWSDEVHAGPDTAYREEELIAALDRLATQLRAAPGERRVPIRRRLARELAAAGDGRTFSPQQRDALEVVSGLLESVRGDGYLPPTFGSWLDKLEVTYNKLATEDTDFLDTSKAPMHAALRFLDGLAELGSLADAGDGMDPAIQGQVDRLLFQIERDYDGGPAVFEHGLEEIEPLLDLQRRRLEGNLQRVARQSEGAHRLVRARRAVVQELGSRLAGREVPALVVELLNPGWRNLLVHTQLRYGSGSEEWRGRIHVVERLLDALSGGPMDPAEAEQLKGELSAGLESISFEPGRRQPLLDALAAALAGRGDAGPVVKVEAGAMAELLGLEHQLPDIEPELEGDSDEADRRQWERWVERARDLEVGTWIHEREDSGRTRILRVAWIGDDQGTFTLVNRKGLKVHDYDMRDLVSGLSDGRLTILDEIDQSLTERASLRMLQNMHNQLAYQATHDALTGLMNRKEYEWRVGQAVIQAGTEDVEHALLFFDLDQFKIINHTSGHDAGDEMLRTLVPQLRHELRGTRAVLARLGGDEFGVLLERCWKDEALALAESLRKSIGDFRFEWGDREYSVTASMGMVAFGGDGRDAATLLQQVDEACYAAKAGGRNRLQVFELEDEGLAARRGAMEWASEVDRILKTDRLRLYAQRIAPIAGGPGAPSHYEVLVMVFDEAGTLMSPIDFIIAAETYDRMPVVDRWIVAHTLSWMSQHREWVDEVHGFSINLSGASLTDEGFLDFVIAEIERTKVPTDKITFEITETSVIASMDEARRFMQRLSDLGCTFSLDDFGTGLASYSYLRNFEVDFVKIDGMFVKDLVNNSADFAVVKSVNEIAHFMGKKTIAECVENDAILERLREIGVDYAQGWGIERPKPLVDFVR